MIPMILMTQNQLFPPCSTYSENISQIGDIDRATLVVADVHRLLRMYILRVEKVSIYRKSSNVYFFSMSFVTLSRPVNEFELHYTHLSE